MDHGIKQFFSKQKKMGRVGTTIIELGTQIFFIFMSGA
jgi:hypothetical protein